MNKKTFEEVSNTISSLISKVNGNFVPASVKDYPPLELEHFDYDQQIDELNFYGEDAECQNFEGTPWFTTDLVSLEEVKLYLKYFIDGTFRTYYWGELEFSEHTFPIVLGETVIGVISRNKEKKKFQMEGLPKKVVNIILPPEEILSEISILKNEFASAFKDIEWLKVYCIERNVIEDKNKRGDLKTAMLGKIRAILHEEERVVATKIQQNENEVIVIDGDLRKEMFEGMDNVIGLAKAFSSKPIIVTDKGYIPLSKILRGLREGQRTCVFVKKMEPQYKFWYIRLWAPEKCENYFQGVVKVEVNQKKIKLPTNDFIDFVNQVSALIFNERMPTSYPLRRWASHIYPIYVAEKVAKSYLTSPLVFRQRFKIRGRSM